jgi:hypothetical protein
LPEALLAAFLAALGFWVFVLFAIYVLLFGDCLRPSYAKLFCIATTNQKRIVYKEEKVAFFHRMEFWRTPNFSLIFCAFCR